MGATPQMFKSYNRGTRNMIVEEAYNMGMFYTNNPLDTAYVKMLINFDYKDDGSSLVPRGGLQPINTVEMTPGYAVYPFVAFTTNVNLKDNNYIEDYRTKCYIVTAIADKTAVIPEYPAERKATLYDNTKTFLYVQDPVTEQFVKSTNVEIELTDPNATPSVAQKDIKFLGEAYNTSITVHDLPLNSNSVRQPVYTVLDNVGYFAYYKDTVKLCRLIVNKKDNAYTHYFEPVDPMVVTVKEVISNGYNMLAANPYTFANTAAASYAIEGILPYNKKPGEADRELLLAARLGQSVNFECVYTYPTNGTKKLRVCWECSTDTGTTWTMLQTAKLVNTANPEATVSPEYALGDHICIDYQPTVREFQMRVSLYEVTAGGDAGSNPIKMLVLPVYTVANTLTTKILKPIKYNLATAAGMMCWKQRVLLWGVAGAENILFTSDLSNPSYFPYPNGIELFDEAIIHVTQFLDNILVFTASNIYIITLAMDGSGLATTMVQNRLSISPLDKHVIQVIKNMVFFKSGNYYYMIVPKAQSLTGELTVAPVSKPIISLFNNFESSVRDAMEAVYYKALPNTYALSLTDYYNYIDNMLIRNVYTFEVTATDGYVMHPFKFNFILNYDTGIRTWTAYVHQANGVLLPFRYTITDTTTLLDVCNVTTKGVVTKSYVQLLRLNNTACVDTLQLNPEEGLRKIPNYQFIDTGYRKHGDQYKKRYREIQMKFNNISNKKLRFYADFLIDDDVRKTYYTYKPTHIIDPTNPNYGLFYIEKVISETAIVNGATTLGGATDEYWELDFSKFPELATTKVRFPVSGKGYVPRLKLLSFNEIPFELNNINWVSRTLYAR